MAFGGVGAAIGAKIVYILTVLPDFIKDLGLITTNFNLFFEKYIASGMVFYGGLIGAVAASVLFCKYMKIRLSDYLTVLVPSLRLYMLSAESDAFLPDAVTGSKCRKDSASRLLTHGLPRIMFRFFRFSLLKQAVK